MSLLVMTLLAQAARDVVASGHPVTLRVPVSDSGNHRATLVEFPESKLEALVAGWEEDELSLERRGNRLFLKLLKPASGDVHVLGASGAVYRLTIVPARAEYDGAVHITPPPERTKRLPAPLELLRAMRRGRRPLEGRVFSADAPLPISPALASRVIRVYESDGFRGYVVRISNISETPRRLDPSRLVATDLVAAGSREMLLKPGEDTLLYLVFWMRP